jgi:hypothetical protein
VLLALHRAALRLERLTRELLSAVAWACTRPARRDAITRAVFLSQPTYLPGGSTFERGLFPYEEGALARPEFPRSGRILLGGAGGGRELRALVERGYAVRAFEPAGRLAEACAEVARVRGDALCLQGSYQDLVHAARHRAGPLAGLLAGAPYDAVILGWGSLSNVTEAAEVEDVLKAARQLAPAGPLLTNFYPPGASPGRAERLGAHLARGLARLGAPGSRPPGGHFHPRGGFIVTYTREELLRIAARHGYRAAASSAGSPAWVLLLPMP